MVIVLAAVGVAVGAFFLLRDGDEAKATRDAQGSAQPDRDVPGASRRAPVRDARANQRDVPAGPDVAVAGGGPAEPLKYEMEDGTQVADHRTNPSKYLRPGVTHPSRSPVDGKVSTAVLQQIRPVVLQCLASVPDDAFEAEAIVMARVVIAIDEAGNLTATEVGADATGLDDATLAPAVACIRAAAPTIQAHVEHAAVESATLVFPIRPLAYRR